MALAATWLISVAFAALVLLVVVASYGVLFFASASRGARRASRLGDGNDVLALYRRVPERQERSGFSVG